MTATKRLSTSDMQVTSIRLESELKERLRELSGEQGYQTLIREVLWDYVERHSDLELRHCLPSEIRATLPATAQREEYCAITGRSIAPREPMLLGWTNLGEWVPLSMASVPQDSRLP
jgi:predicted DNA-binding protein